MNKRVSGLMVLFCGCNTGFDATKGERLENDVTNLQTRVDALETDNRALQSQVAALSDQLNTAETTLAAVEELLAVLSVNGDGDVVIDGANLWVYNGTGNTAGEPNAKGNLFVGYNEQGRCVGGSNPGGRCGDGISVCAGGTCEPGDGSESTGSHNLIVGSWHQHASYSGIAGGVLNTLQAPHCTALGGGNVCSAQRALLAGEGNTAEGDSCSVLGGLGGTCSGELSVVVGGFQNEATADQSIVPQ
ncbi:hypothetical protein ACFL6C_08210 [Myxococcota bacterium]